MGKTPASLRLLDVRSWQDSDNILVRYEVLPKSVETQKSMETDRKDTWHLLIAFFLFPQFTTIERRQHSARLSTC